MLQTLDQDLLQHTDEARVPRPTYPAYAITAVCYRADPARIAMVKVCPVVPGEGSALDLFMGEQLRLRRAEVAAWLTLGVAFFTYSLKGNVQVKARVRTEMVDGDVFLRTSPNETRADNLGELPKFDCDDDDS